jgi:hypothetical protein
MGREIVYSQTRAGHFEPVISRAVKRQQERDRKNRRETLLGLAIIGVAFAAWAGGLIVVAMV